ncbi:unnamed protein product [Didymodactylos carnosus]|uniref:CCDC92/74 N-terminal domain-containing protein n=1 Tax=Didymodactylos carnosus TaxID=1234261 RepID=A0A814UX45_9BILA|nr:unnamed protein product [Didymodactylos carnosus]CAF1179987.1 unnamed protein product [Didymodactylos carnosus]CAF3656641.1 unnamed protein product [Didymodactylos carnosus]CAF3944263.1 unnamed protein product [Didymodactylos carnosus]
MMRQSLIDERRSDLVLSDPTNRRLHRITTIGDKNPHVHIRKNNHLNNNNSNDQQQQSQEISDSSPSSQYYEQQSDFSPFSPNVDPRQRIDHLERNIKYIQQQHEHTLQDLHNEVDRLQQENRGMYRAYHLHFHLINIRPSSRNSRSDIVSQVPTTTTNGTVDRNWTKPTTTTITTIVPTASQISDLSKTETNLGNRLLEEKRLQEVQRLYYEKQVEELKQKLIELERKNEYLVKTIDDFKKRAVATQPTSTVISQPPPQPLFPETDNSSITQDIQKVTITTHNKSFSPVSLSSITSLDPLQVTIEPSVSREPTPEECIQLIKIAHETYRKQKQEISVMKAIFKELLHSENLSSTSRTLVRDCLTSSTTSDILFGQKTTRFVPNDGLIKRQPSSSSKRTTDYLHARHLESRGTLHLRRLTLSPPNLSVNPLSSWRSASTRPSDRLILPPIQQGSTPIHESPYQRLSDTHTDNLQFLNNPINRTVQQQQQTTSRFNETTVARRERRTQELQRTRLTRNLYH